MQPLYCTPRQTSASMLSYRALLPHLQRPFSHTAAVGHASSSCISRRLPICSLPPITRFTPLGVLVRFLWLSSSPIRILPPSRALMFIVAPFGKPSAPFISFSSQRLFFLTCVSSRTLSFFGIVWRARVLMAFSASIYCKADCNEARRDAVLHSQHHALHWTTHKRGNADLYHLPRVSIQRLHLISST
jgi:hypothetical protein